MDDVGVLVDLQRVTVNEPERPLLRELSVTISDGDRLGVVGINGTGKSTLLRLIAGRFEPDEGVIHRRRGLSISFLDQRPDLGTGTVRHAVGDSWQSEAAVDRLGISEHLDSDVSSLSGGQAKRAALARALATPCDLLILDEPTNHLDLAGVAWLERWLGSYVGALIIVSHDRHLLDRVTTRMLELDRGSGFLHEGGYASYLEAKAEREEAAASAESSRRNLARRELAWLRRGAQARSTKPRARVEAATRLIEQRPLEAARANDLTLDTTTPRLGNTVIELHDVGFAHEGAPPLLSHVELLIGPGDRFGVIGRNGSGKTSLLDLVAGRRAPTSGRVRVGKTVVVGYYDQHGETLDPDLRVQDVVAGPERNPGSLEDIALMKRFWFTGNLPHTRVGDLSGGERRRLQLLAVLARQPNVLLLDEPTNDLDIDTLRALEDFLDDWPGTLVVVSHDRAFLERTIETALAIDDVGHLRKVPGGLDAWVSSQLNQVSSGESTAATGSTVSDPTIGRRLRELDKQVARLERQREKLNAQLTTCVDHVEMVTLGRRLDEVRAQLSDAEEEWLTLADEANSA